MVVIATPKDHAKLKSSLAKEFRLNGTGEKLGSAEVWRSEEGELAFAIAGERVLLGHAESVVKCLTGTGQQSSLIEAMNAAGSVPAFSFATDNDPDAELVSVFGQLPDERRPLIQTYKVSTSFTSKGIQRTETSSFGLIGSVIEQFAKDQ